MFNLHDFILKGIRGMIGKEPDYKVIQYSVSYLDKGVLAEADLAELSGLIDEKNSDKSEVTADE